MESTAAEIALFIALAMGGLVAGGQLFCMLAIIPAFGDWTLEMGILVHQSGLSERPHRYLRVLSAIAVIAALATVVIEAIDNEVNEPVVLTAVGFVLSIFNGIYSQREWPINHEIDSYGTSPTPDQVERYKGLRKTWDEQHRIRTAATVTALVCFSAAASFTW